MHLAESWQKNPQVRSHTFTVGGPLRTSPFIFPFSSNPTLAPVGTPFFLATYSGFSLSCLHESCCCSMVCVYLQRNTCSCVSIICSLSAYATKLLRFMRVRNMPPCLWHHRHPAQCLEPSRDQTYSSTDQLPPASEASWKVARSSAPWISVSSKSLDVEPWNQHLNKHPWWSLCTLKFDSLCSIQSINMCQMLNEYFQRKGNLPFPPTKVLDSQGQHQGKKTQEKNTLHLKQ